LYGERSVFLIDTYDTVRAATRIAESGLRPAAVRLDSGDVLALSRDVRQIFDRAGLVRTGIFVSGDLDEQKIAAMLEQGAPVDGFGVGTAISTSSDAPALGGVYKLVEIDRGERRVPTIKRSTGKASYAGCKQVWRTFDEGRARGDLLGLADEAGPEGSVALVGRVMQDGRRTKPSPALSDLRTRCLEQVKALPDEVRRLDEPDRYPVRISERLADLTAEVSSRI
jgi:nicotinate phosphoribosyltransferase